MSEFCTAPLSVKCLNKSLWLYSSSKPVLIQFWPC